MRPLLMIPGPIEVSPEVAQAISGPTAAHLDPRVIEAFGASLGMMRTIWRSSENAQPFVISGGGTTAMDMAVTNLVDATDTVLVINTGYFGDRASNMIQRRGAKVEQLKCVLGTVPTAEDVAKAIRLHKPSLVWATHVDTSTGVRTHAPSIAAAAKQAGALVVFDGVCATGGEAFDMAGDQVDVYLTASQKALGLPPGLALMVVSPAAMAKRRALSTPPPMSLDFLEWLPIMQAYESRSKSYFSTPNTALILGLERSLSSIVERGVEATTERHKRVANAFRQAWGLMNLSTLPTHADWAANTLSAVYYPDGVNATFLAEVKRRGVLIAGGLHPELKPKYFRVGHMGYSVDQNNWLLQTVLAIQGGLESAGHPTAPSLAEEFESWISENI